MPCNNALRHAGCHQEAQEAQRLLDARTKYQENWNKMVEEELEKAMRKERKAAEKERRDEVRERKKEEMRLEKDMTQTAKGMEEAKRLEAEQKTQEKEQNEKAKDEKKEEEPAAPANGEAALKNDPEYAKYFKMLKMGMAKEQVLHALKRDGKDESILSMLLLQWKHWIPGHRLPRLQTSELWLIM